MIGILGGGAAAAIAQARNDKIIINKIKKYMGISKKENMISEEHKDFFINNCRLADEQEITFLWNHLNYEEKRKLINKEPLRFAKFKLSGLDTKKGFELYSFLSKFVQVIMIVSFFASALNILLAIGVSIESGLGNISSNWTLWASMFFVPFIIGLMSFRFMNYCNHKKNELMVIN